MSGDELDALAAEFPEPALAPEPSSEAAPEAVPEAVPSTDMSPAMLKAAIGGCVRVGARIMCARARVTDLEAPEVDALAEAVFNVVVLYDVRLDPKVAAWLGLGLVTAGVVSNRKPLPKPEGPAVVVEGAGEKPPEKPAPKSYDDIAP